MAAVLLVQVAVARHRPERPVQAERAGRQAAARPVARARAPAGRERRCHEERGERVQRNGLDGRAPGGDPADDEGGRAEAGGDGGALAQLASRRRERQHAQRDEPAERERAELDPDPGRPHPSPRWPRSMVRRCLRRCRS
ncbi:MAG: hypothetical protein R3C15_12935 [Thermoleophilia bacterium]